MTTAPVADQRRLLDLQELDTRAAKLGHQRRSHPAIAALAELQGRADDLHRAQVRAATEASDLRRAVAKAEADVDQVRTRAQRTTEKLNSGQGLSRELVALQEELAHLGHRESVLEEEQLEVMTALEEAERSVADIEKQEAAVRADVDARAAERDEAWAGIDAELAQVTAARADLAASLRGSSPEMVDLYERARERSGGLGAVALRGHATEGAYIDFTLAELSTIDAAAPEQVLTSEDHGYVLVRLTPA